MPCALRPGWRQIQRGRSSATMGCRTIRRQVAHLEAGWKTPNPRSLCQPIVRGEQLRGTRNLCKPLCPGNSCVGPGPARLATARMRRLEEDEAAS
jgi:hypothetical protein